MPEGNNFTLIPKAPSRAVAYEDILTRLNANGRPCNGPWLRSVYEYAAEMHQDQRRRSGEPYMTHPVQVAFTLADQRFDQTCVAVALLHDVLEDTGATRRSLAEQFGEEIAELVDGVSKIGRHEYVRRDEAQAETFRKLILASAKDIRVILVKLADRLHNMQTLEHMPAEARRRIAQETLEIYAPLAHRLGMSRLRGDLEDLAFYHLYPHQFRELRDKLEEKMTLGRETTRRIRDSLGEKLKESGIDAEINYRVKGYYSIYEKLRRQRINISQLYDYLAFRVITSTLKDTYAVLGVVHQNWRPIPGRFKDYIAVPKPNLYQSLHTTVVGGRGQPFEVQIRTQEMDQVAEEGIAAHWRYKQGKPGATDVDQNILWLRQLLEWEKEVQDPRTFMATLKLDLYPDEVYVFTPKGDVFSFPRGSTPLDFAYRIHTELGHHCAGSRVNGRLVPLRTLLHNGDIVEILTNSARVPSRDWLSFVATSRAKSKIRQWLNTQQKLRAVEIGRRLMEKELRKLRLSPKKVEESEALAKYLSEEGLSTPEDLFSRLGFGRVSVRHLLNRILSQEQLAESEESPGALRRAVKRILPSGKTAIVVRGQEDLLATLAKCCNPVPGEPIVGYVTRGRGVSVHSAECPNVRNLLYHPEREIEVAWARNDDSMYEIGLKVEAEDRPGMLARLTEVIARANCNIRHIEAKTAESDVARIGLVVEVKNRRHLDKLQQSIGAIPGVLIVDRRMGTPAPQETSYS